MLNLKTILGAICLKIQLQGNKILKLLVRGKVAHTMKTIQKEQAQDTVG